MRGSGGGVGAGGAEVLDVGDRDERGGGEGERCRHDRMFVEGEKRHG